MARSGVLGGIIASIIGAVASLLVERAWTRRKEKLAASESEHQRANQSKGES